MSDGLGGGMFPVIPRTDVHGSVYAPHQTHVPASGYTNLALATGSTLQQYRGFGDTTVTTTTTAPMTTTTKVLIGAGVLAAAFVGYKLLSKKSRRR